MDLAPLLIGAAVFSVLYQGMGLLLDRRRPSRQAWDTTQPASRKWLDRLADSAAQWGPNRLLLGNKNYRERVENLLLRSGNPFRWSAEMLLLYKELLGIFSILMMVQGDNQNPLTLLVGFIFGFKILDIYLSLKATARRDDIQRNL